ncbi:MAG: hypothetical protein AAF696_17365, partial [Bacteroidota bacterium]
MYIKSTFICLLLFSFSLNLVGQNRRIYGRALSERLDPFEGLHIYRTDTFLLAKTDGEGRFEISLPQGEDSLLLGAAGMEWTYLKLKDNCDSVEIILMYYVKYNYRSLNKIDRQRKKSFDKLALLHATAVREGLFSKNQLCYERNFSARKPGLRKIREDLRKAKKENLQDFKDLEIGEVVKIPLGLDESKKILNTHYSICRACTEEDYPYVIEGEILNKHRKHL